MLIEAVVGQRQDIALGAQVVPGKGSIEVGVRIRLVGDALLVRHALLLGVACQVALGIAGIEVVERAAQAEPTPVAVACGEVEALGLDAAVVLVDAEAGTTHGIEAALDVILRVAIDVAALHVKAVPAQLTGITQVEVDVVTVLGAEVGASGFHVLVAEEFVGCGQAIGFLVRKLGLEAVEDEPRARRTVAEGADLLGHIDVAAHAVRALGNRTPVILVIIFAEGRKVPTLGRHQAIGQAGDVLARHLGDVEARDLRRPAAIGDGGALEGAEDVVQGEGMAAADAVVHGQRGIPILVGRLIVLVGLLAGAGQGTAVAQPVVLPRGGVDVLRQVMVIVGSEDKVKTLRQEIALAVLQRGDKGVPLAVLLSEDDVLIDACLYLLIIITIGET